MESDVLWGLISSVAQRSFKSTEGGGILIQEKRSHVPFRAHRYARPVVGGRSMDSCTATA